MKRCFAVLMLIVASSTFVSALTPHATLTLVKKTHYHRDKRVTPHKAHKAGKHHTPKRQHHQQS
jgi:hypothetical protein